MAATKMPGDDTKPSTGFSCPHCRSDDQVDIAATVWVRATQDGTDADESEDGSHEYSDASQCCCRACGWTGTVGQARVREEEEAPATKSPGQIAYEEDVRRQPLYNDGAKRIGWHEISDVARKSWELQPTPREYRTQTKKGA